MADIPQNKGNPQIPDEAIQQEKVASSSGKNKNLADDEQRAFGDRNYEDLLEGSLTKTQLLHLCLYRCGITLIFIVACLSVLFAFILLGIMLWTYVAYVMKNPERLGEFLSHIWTIMTGASVIVFVQLLGAIIKSKADEFKGRNQK